MFCLLTESKTISAIPAAHEARLRTYLIMTGTFVGRPGERLVLFDNERGKGDHKHIREAESPYDFENIETLTEDFIAAVRAVQAEEGK